MYQVKWCWHYFQIGLFNKFSSLCPLGSTSRSLRYKLPIDLYSVSINSARPSACRHRPSSTMRANVATFRAGARRPRTKINWPSSSIAIDKWRSMIRLMCAFITTSTRPNSFPVSCKWRRIILNPMTRAKCSIRKLTSNFHKYNFLNGINKLAKNHNCVPLTHLTVE